jgi:exodeoxyribonuclease VII large subunit
MKDLFDLPFEAPEPDPEPGPEPRQEPPDAPQASPEPAEARRRIWTVTDLTAAIRDLLETRFAEVWVEGELSNCRAWNTGHLYFTIKDPAAQIKAVMWRSALRALRFKPEDGLHVVARGRVSVYDPKGEYQLVCEHMEPKGAGALQVAFEQLKKRLAGEGLFDPARKRPLPALPRKIGIVTSLDGAAIRDIVKVISRRHPNVHLVIRPARVQGEGAAWDVARGLAAVARVPGVDVVIVGRGGGSIEDLWAFNEERVARAIARSPVPVISAVGHETDFTIADFVADLRAPTPSAAAEMVVAGKDEFCARIDRLAHRAHSASARRIERLRALTHRLAGRPGLAGFRGRLALRGRHVAELTHQVGRTGRALVAARQRRYHGLRLALETFDLRRRIGGVRARLTRGGAALRAAAVRAHHRADSRLRTQAARLETLSPLAVLGRGYAVCWDVDRTRIIRDASTVRQGDGVRVTLHEGELECRVTKTTGR